MSRTTSQPDPTLFPSKIIPKRVLRAGAPPDPDPTFFPLAPNTVLLAIDPSIANCGWAIVKNTSPHTTRLDSGVFHPTNRPDLNRHDHLSDLIVQRVEMARLTTNKPTDALIEVPSGGQWRNTGLLMAYTRAIGVCEATCYRLGLRVHRVNVQTWKGNQKKSPTIRVVQYAFKYTPREDNEADALGLGLWLCSKTRRPT